MKLITKFLKIRGMGGGGSRGIALLMVLWVLTLMIVIVFEFTYTMRMEAHITSNFRDEAQSYFLARAGVERAIAELIKNEIEKKKSAVADDDDGDDEEEKWLPGNPPREEFLEGGSYRVVIESEGGKININKISSSRLRTLLENMGIESEEKDIIWDSILDWKDSNSLHRVNGAEDDYYLGLPEPYQCKDGNFTLTEELLLVRGITPELFYGTPRIPDQEESEPSVKKVYFSGMITVYSDSKKVDINSAPLEVFSILPDMTEDTAREIVEYRQDKKFKRLSELRNLVGNERYLKISPFVTIASSPYYTIVSTGKVKDGQASRTIKALVKINPKGKEKFRVVKWIDYFPYSRNLFSPRQEKS